MRERFLPRPNMCFRVSRDTKLMLSYLEKQTNFNRDIVMSIAVHRMATEAGYKSVQTANKKRENPKTV
jgi:hypothetical protein